MNIVKSQTVSFSGHRTSKLDMPIDKLYDKILGTITNLYLNEGYNTFLSGMAIGYDMLSAIAVTELKLTYSDVRLIGVVPFKEQEKKYTVEDRNLYNRIIQQCDDVVVVCNQFSMSAYFKRNDFLIDNSTKLVCYYNGLEGGTKYTYDKALKIGMPVINLYKE